MSDRDSQFILAEATKASNINGSTKRAFDEDGLWSGSADAAWSVYEVGIVLETESC